MRLKKPSGWRKEPSYYGKPGLMHANKDGSTVLVLLSKHEDQFNISYDNGDGTINVSLYLNISTWDQYERGEPQTGLVKVWEGKELGTGVRHWVYFIPVPLDVLRWVRAQASDASGLCH